MRGNNHLMWLMQRKYLIEYAILDAPPMNLQYLNTLRIGKM